MIDPSHGFLCATPCGFLWALQCLFNNTPTSTTSSMARSMHRLKSINTMQHALQALWQGRTRSLLGTTDPARCNLPRAALALWTPRMHIHKTLPQKQTKSGRERLDLQARPCLSLVAPSCLLLVLSGSESMGSDFLELPPLPSRPPKTPKPPSKTCLAPGASADLSTLLCTPKHCIHRGNAPWGGWGFWAQEWEREGEGGGAA